MVERKCFVCGVEMQEKTTSIKAGWGKYILTIEGVKAYVCPKCGEEVFTTKEAQMIEELSKNLSGVESSMKPDLLNVSETADLLRISPQSVYNMIKDGRLKAIKAGREWRFMRKDIKSMLSGRDLSIAARELM